MICAICNIGAAFGAFNFPSIQIDLNKQELDYLNTISTTEWQQYVQLGVDSVNRQKNLESNLLNTQTTVQNGSISHVQLLDCLPNSRAQKDSELAYKILKSSLYVFNSKCATHGISGEKCAAFLANQELPKKSQLYEDCLKITESARNGHHAFRRLLPRNYKDGFYEMFEEDKLPSPRLISSKTFNNPNLIGKQELFDDQQATLALVQWTQFIEHDLSKPVVNSMINGYSIECCNRDNFKLQPRYRHPACAPLLAKNDVYRQGRETCLNYVRSALAIGSKCTFGAAEQLNQATGYLDLSQLYGFTNEAQMHMRTYNNGEIKSTAGSSRKEDLLPMAADDMHTFCALKLDNNDSTCFMAGDSRVNNNPLAIVIYTIFMRNHNQIANQLKSKHSNWNDERLFQTAKSINVHIYRRIVFNEWLPIVLGKAKTLELLKEPLYANGAKEVFDDFEISNEFAVAGIRFYFSMMPSALYNYSNLLNKQRTFNDILTEPKLFLLKEQIYKSGILNTSSSINIVLESLLQQRAMKMDATYDESLIVTSSSNVKPTHADVLAFDIQRGRDHGLQGYVKYLELCENVKINDWKDLEKYISKEDIGKLRSVYTTWLDIDLMVGGIAEIPTNGSTVGTTFTCILAEQFSKIRQRQYAMDSQMNDSTDLLKYETMTAAELLCANSDLEMVPQNIFQLQSDKNQLISCVQRFYAIQL